MKTEQPIVLRVNGKFDSLIAVDALKSEPIAANPIVFRMERPGKAIYATGGGLAALIPAYQGLATILSEAVICFAGTAWMFGHRTEAIEKLIGAAAGLLIILQAHNIVVWLKALLA